MTTGELLDYASAPYIGPAPPSAVPVDPTEPDPGTDPGDGGPVITDPGGAQNGERLYVDPISEAARELQSALAQGRTADAAKWKILAEVPHGVWFGNYSGEDAKLARVVSECNAQDACLHAVLYNIPGRDNDFYSAGGAASVAAYKTWIDKIAPVLAKVNKTVFITLEPDSIAQRQPDDEQAARNQALAYAVNKLAQYPNLKVYPDGGTPGWRTAAQLAAYIAQIGTKKFAGVQVNNANHHYTNECLAWGSGILSALGHSGGIVIDTSRNGRGPYKAKTGDPGQITWCNCGFQGTDAGQPKGDGTVVTYPSPRGLGVPPVIAPPQIPKVHAILWSKIVGQSDGAFPPGSPGAGGWMPKLALDTVDARVKQSAPNTQDLGLIGWPG